VDRLLGEAAAFRQANDIRAYVETVRSANATAAPVSPKEFDAWATWALAQADRIDPVRSKRFLVGVVDDTDSSRENDSRSSRRPSLAAVRVEVSTMLSWGSRPSEHETAPSISGRVGINRVIAQRRAKACTTPHVRAAARSDFDIPSCGTPTGAG
jgi:hypothetical protein